MESKDERLAQVRQLVESLEEELAKRTKLAAEAVAEASKPVEGYIRKWGVGPWLPHRGFRFAAALKAQRALNALEVTKSQLILAREQYEQLLRECGGEQNVQQPEQE